MKTGFHRKGVVWVGVVLVLFSLAVILHGGFDLKDAFLLLGLCFACELIDSGFGMGYGTILTPTLLLLGFEAADIVPTVLLSELLSGFTAAFFHHEIRNVNLSLKGDHLKPALILAAGSISGVTLFLAKGGYINLLLFVPMCTGALVSVPFAVFAINKAKEDHLKIVIGVLTLTMGTLTIYKALT